MMSKPKKKLKALTPKLNEKLSQFDNAVRSNVLATSEALNKLNDNTRQLMATEKLSLS
ncbi:hypothetical protein IC611_20425 [Proteus mirabilis]